MEKPTAEPINTIFLSQATDESFALKLINKEQLNFIFKINYLFFDYITLGASDLLGNPLLCDLFNENKDAMSSIYKKGIFRPVYLGSIQSMTEVAENMIKDKTKHNLLTNKSLMKHARLIDDCSPTNLFVDRGDFRIDYYDNIYSISEFINSNGLSPRYTPKIKSGDFKKFLEWLKNEAPRDDLRCSDVFKFADNNFRRNKSYRYLLKLLGESVYQYTLSSKLIVSLSGTNKSSSLMDCLKLLRNELGYVDYSVFKKELTSDMVSIPLPFKEISTFSIEELTEIRNLDKFRKLRDVLSKFRAGNEHIKDKDILKPIFNCKDQLLCYIEENIPTRKFLIDSIEKGRVKSYLRVFCDISQSVFPVILCFMIDVAERFVTGTATNDLNSGKLIIAVAMSNVLHRCAYYSFIEDIQNGYNIQNNNNIYSEVIRYSPIYGITGEKKKLSIRYTD